MRVCKRLTALWLAGMLLAADGFGRELAMDPEEMVAVELAGVGVNPTVGTPVVLLREMTSGDVVPIFIGVPEARAILMAMHEVEVPRPMTHDLMKSVLEATDVVLKRVFVDQLQENTYYGMLELEMSGHNEPVRVDSRPSDALALAVRTGAMILVAPTVLVAGEDLEYEGLEQDQVATALGITVVALTAEYRQTLNLPDERGLLVRRTTGRAAAEGLAAGSLILSVNDEVPATPMDFLELVRDTPEGGTVRIRYWRDGAQHELALPADLVPVDPEEGSRVEI